MKHLLSSVLFPAIFSLAISSFYGGAQPSAAVYVEPPLEEYLFSKSDIYNLVATCSVDGTPTALFASTIYLSMHGNPMATRDKGSRITMLPAPPEYPKLFERLKKVLPSKPEMFIGLAAVDASRISTVDASLSVLLNPCDNIRIRSEQLANDVNAYCPSRERACVTSVLTYTHPSMKTRLYGEPSLDQVMAVHRKHFDSLAKESEVLSQIARSY